MRHSSAQSSCNHLPQAHDIQSAPAPSRTSSYVPKHIQQTLGSITSSNRVFRTCVVIAVLLLCLISMFELILILDSISLATFFILTLPFPFCKARLAFSSAFFALSSAFCFCSCSFSSYFLFLSSFSRSSCSSCFLLSFSSIWAIEDALVSNLARGKASSTLAGVDISEYANRSARVVEGSTWCGWCGGGGCNTLRCQR